MNNRICVGLLAVVAISMNGCSGDAEGRKPTHEVTGIVKFNGGPVVGAFVAFSPRDGQPVATGTTDDSGKYTLTTYETGDGAVEGDYIAVVTKVPQAKTAESDDEHGVDAEFDAESHAADEEEGSKSLLPAKYATANSSDLQVTVKAGESNSIDLPLE